jgi:cardiolipin synthase A/B
MAPWMARIRKRIWIGAAIGVAVTVALTIAVLNFAGPEKQVRMALATYPGLDDPQFRRELATLLGAPLIAGNRVENLENGERIFPAMLAAVRSAQRSISFETYIYWSGSIGREFAEAFAERARAGVRVHVLLDWVGSEDIDEELIRTMLAAGVDVQRFHPLRWYNIGRMNNRTHRKLLIVDGRVGFTGGVGIADQWDGDASHAGQWRDSHYRIEGPAVAHMQAVFQDNWTQTAGEVLQGTAYFPELSAAGDAVAQVFASSPDGGGDSMQLMYLMLIAAAERSIDLSAAYFVPDRQALDALLAAMQRGVRLRIVVPGPLTDHQIVRRASRAMWGELLRSGAEIHEFMPTLFHCKTLIIDGAAVSVGSTNFDNRSFRLNDEASVNLFDPAFAARATAVFEADIARSQRVTLEQWERRPWRERLAERWATLFSSQL